MDTQDHHLPNNLGHDGHGGHHVCHKCGWPYPNPRPSSKIRRAHKKVCGTIEKYRLDNDAEDKTHVDGQDGEHHSSDDLETSRGINAEKTISRSSSSSSVGSRSSRSTRSEDDMFTDAVTEFSESSAVVTRQASGGGMQRFYSMQNENELDDTKPDEENLIGDNLCSTDLLKDNQLQPVRSVEGKKSKVEASKASQNHISTNFSPVSASVTLEAENAADKNILHSSEPSNELDIILGRGKESVSSEDEPQPRTSYTETREYITEDVGELGIVKGCCDETHEEAINSENGITSKAADSDGVFSDDVIAYSLKNKQEESQKSVGEQKTFGERELLSDADLFNGDVSIFNNEEVDGLKMDYSEGKKDSGTEEKKTVAIFPEGAIVDAKETTSNADLIRSDVEDDREYFTVLDNDGSKVPKDDLVFIKPFVNEVTMQDPENLHISCGIGNDEDNTVEGAILNEHVESEGAVENVGTEMGPSEESDRTGDRSKLDRILDSGDVISDHSRGENVVTSQCVVDIESSDKNVGKEECMAHNDSDATVKIDDQRNSTLKVEVVECSESSCQSQTAVIDRSLDISCVSGGVGEIKQHVTISAIDTNADSGSLADSLDGNWGSVSVLSATSNTLPTSDTTTSYHPQAEDGEETPSMMPKPVIDNQVSSIPEAEIEQTEHASEIHSSNKPNRGNKGKEIMTNVAYWDSGKHNTPLKTLLGEATAISRGESPAHQNQGSSSTSVPQNDGIQGTNNGFSSKTEYIIINSDHPEIGKEWNSRARYPVSIKTEKKRSKSKAYWVPFLCCSSANAR